MDTIFIDNFKIKLDQYIKDCAEYSSTSPTVYDLIAQFIKDTNAGKKCEYDTFMINYISYKLNAVQIMSNEWFHLFHLNTSIQALSK